MSNEADRGNGTKDVHRIYLSLTIVKTRQFCTYIGFACMNTTDLNTADHYRSQNFNPSPIALT